MLKIILFATFLTLTLGGKFRFDNYSLYKVTYKTPDDINTLRELQSDEKFDFWSEPIASADFVTILSSPEDKVYLENYLNTRKLGYEITLPNIQDVIDKERVEKYTSTRITAGNMRWDAYYELDDIYAWLDDLARVYPDVASVIFGGTSYEGREIKGIKISHGPGRKSIFIESGIHSREWIAPATTNYIINELLSNNNEETQAAARNYDWYIFPVTNPDGYIWTHTEFRMWRKNRRPFGNDFGVDLNRNWDDNWAGVGSSNVVSSNTYHGPSPFSEEETRTLSEYITSLAEDMELYLSFHSSGQLLLLPFGNTTTPLANYYDAINIGRRAMGALSVRYGTPYTTGNIAEAIYLATGTSIDWVKEALNVPLTYCYELRDRGTYGHLLPPDQILPTGEEVMDSLLEMIHQAQRFGYMKVDEETDPNPDCDGTGSATGLQATIFTAAIVLVQFWIY